MIVYEPHSDVTPALINNCVIVNESLELYDLYSSENPVDYIYFPDAGAQKRYAAHNVPSMIGIKKRDFETGKIVGLDIIGEQDVKGKHVVIIDDLCSKGGSFIPPAKRFKENGASKVVLIVTHCEDNIFNGEILTTDYIDLIVTTNSILTKEHNKISIERIF